MLALCILGIIMPALAADFIAVRETALDTLFSPAGNEKDRPYRSRSPVGSEILSLIH